MANFNEQIADGLNAASEVYGESFTLNTSLATFVGVCDIEFPQYADEVGELDESINAAIMAHKAQFVYAGVLPEVGNTVTYNGKDYELLRVNEDAAGYQLLLRG